MSRVVARLDAQEWPGLPMAGIWYGTQLYQLAVESGLLVTAPRPPPAQDEGPRRSALGGSMGPLTVVETMVEVPVGAEGWRQLFDALAALVRLTGGKARRP